MTIPSPATAAPPAPPPSGIGSRVAAHLLGVGMVTVALAALPTAPSDLDRHQLPKEAVLHLAVLAAALLARPAWPGRLTRWTAWAALAAVLWAVITSFVALNPWMALRATTLTASGVTAFVVARHLASQRLGNVLLGWAVAAGVAGTATAIAQAYGADTVLFTSRRAPGGTFGNRNFAAHFGVLVLPVVVTLALSARRTLTALGLSLAVIPPVWITVLSRSRAAWLGALAVGAVFAIAAHVLARRGHRIAWGRVMMLVLAAGGAAALAMTLPNTLQWRTDSPYAETLGGIANHREGSGRGRMLQYQNTAQLALDHPVTGVGPGNWALRYGDVAPASDPSWSRGDVIPLNPWPSSDWMALLSERGVVGALLIVALGLGVAWSAWRATRAAYPVAIAGTALLALLVATAVQGSFDAVMLLAAPLILVTVSAGALLGAADGDPFTLVETAPRAHAIVGVLALLVVATGALRSAQQVAAYVMAGSGRDTGRLVWAARVDPWSYPIRIALAMREPCRAARDDAAAVLRLAPTWPAARIAARRCGVRR